MKKFIILLAIFCVIGTGAFAQIQQDTVITDYPFGVSLNSVQTLTNKTLTSPQITPQTSLPTCDSSNEGKVDYYKSTTAPGFMVSCIDNGGFYELVPMSQKTTGFLWTVEDFDRTSSGIHDETGSWSYDEPDANHHGIGWLGTTGAGTNTQYIAFLTDTSTGSSRALSTDAPNWVVEWIVRPAIAVTNVRYRIGLMDEVNGAHPAGAYFDYNTGGGDTTWWVTTDNGSSTDTETAVTVTADTWYRLIAYYNGTDVKFYIGSGGGDVTLVATHTTNLPTSKKLVGYAEVKEDSAASREMKFDYYRLSSLGLDR